MNTICIVLLYFYMIRLNVIDISKRFVLLFYIAQCVVLLVSEILTFWPGKKLMTVNNVQAHSFGINHASKMLDLKRCVYKAKRNKRGTRVCLYRAP